MPDKQEKPERPEQGRGLFFRAAGAIGAATLLSRVLGLAREVAFAAIFGATWVTDAYRIAFAIPYTLRRLLGEGSLSAFFVPVFAEEREANGEDGAFRFAQSLYTLFLIVVSAAVVIGLVTMPAIIAVIAPGFVKHAATFSLAVKLGRIMLPYMVLMMTSALAMGVLNSVFKFGIPALSPVVMNLFVLAAIVFLVPRFGTLPQERVYALTVGVLAGGVGQVLLQVPSLKRSGFRFRLRFNFSHPGIKRTALLMVPAIFSLGIVRINLLVDTAAASLVGVGAVTLMVYAERLLQFPMGVFGFSLANALLPRISVHAARGEMAEFRNMISFALRASLFITLPATAGLLVLGGPLVSVIYRHGAFGEADAAATALILAAFAVGLFAFVGMQIITPAFYALKLPKEPIKGSVVALAANVVFVVAFGYWLKAPGIALAVAASTACAFFYLLYRLQRVAGSIGYGRIAAASLPVVGASLIIALLSLLGRAGMDRFVPDVAVYRAGAILVIIGAAVPAYVACAKLFKYRDVDDIMAFVLRRKKRGREETP